MEDAKIEMMMPPKKEQAQASCLSELLYVPFWGAYEINSSYMMWHPNQNLKMTADEQFEWNRSHHDDFVIFKTLEPCCVVTFR